MYKKPEVMIVDDEAINLSVLTKILTPHYDVRAFKSGIDALSALQTSLHPDIVLLDINMPDMNGWEVIDRMHANDKLAQIPVIFITSLDATLDEETGFRHGAVDYIIKPLKPALILARIKSHLELKRSKDKLKDQNAWLEAEVNRRMYENQLVFDITLDIVTQLVETRDEETANHILRTRSYMEILVRRLKHFPKYSLLIDEAYIERVVKACPLHDIGKVGIPDQLLLKPGKLTPEEFEIVKEHSRIGYNSMKSALENSVLNDLIRSSGNSSANDFFKEAMNITLYHHESYNGSGYPEGLEGEDIPLSARMMKVVDAFDALSNKRVYKQAWSFEETFKYLREQAGIQFDPDCVLAFEQEQSAVREIWNRLSVA